MCVIRCRKAGNCLGGSELFFLHAHGELVRDESAYVQGEFTIATGRGTIM